MAYPYRFQDTPSPNPGNFFFGRHESMTVFSNKLDVNGTRQLADGFEAFGAKNVRSSNP